MKRLPNYGLTKGNLEMYINKNKNKKYDCFQRYEYLYKLLIELKEYGLKYEQV